MTSSFEDDEISKKLRVSKSQLLVAREQRQLLVKYLRHHADLESESVFNALNKVPRHQFLPLGLRDLAYRDCPLRIDCGQTISQPYIVAYMTQAATLSASDKVLEIGTGCGYQTAILAELANQVYTVEIRPQLSTIAQQTLADLGYSNIHFKIGDGYQGWGEAAPYDKILVTAAPPQIPIQLVNQLAVGGKMVIPVGTAKQKIQIVSQTEAGVDIKTKITVRFVPMITTEELSSP